MHWALGSGRLQAFRARGREAVAAEPPGFEAPNDFESGFKASGFLHERVSAQVVRALNVSRFGRGAEDDYDDVLQGGLLAEPGEDLKAGDPGEFEIEKDNAGERVPGPVGEVADTAKVVDGHLAVGGKVQGVTDTGKLEDVANQDDVGFFVFDLKDARGGFAGHAAAGMSVAFWLGEPRGSWTQKRLPLPGSESRQIWPPVRSRDLRTRAKPMPVPEYSSGRCKRWNMPKIFSCWSLGMPMPLSSTQMRT